MPKIIYATPVNDPPATAMYCCNCCKDIDLPLQSLIYPEMFLNADGLEFMRVHGMLTQEFRRDGMVKFKLNDHDYDIQFRQLAMPLAFLDANGQKFFIQHGLYEAIRKNVVVKVFHRCEKLTENGRCSIYAERPKLCQDYDCRAKRHDCENDAPTD